MHPVIVGIDPGTTSAFAILSFDFKVIAIRSKKEYSLAGIIQDIYKYGNPILVGTDKKEVPSFIKEFSQKTGTIVYSPRYDTKKGEKLFIVKEKKFTDLVKNAHETDALASAIYAYNEYLQLIKKIDGYIEKNNKEELRDKLLIKVITEDKSISDAVFELEAKPVKKVIEKKVYPKIEKTELTIEEKQIFLLNEVIEKLRDENKNLRHENEMLRDKRVDINKETKKLISFKEHRALSVEKEKRYLKRELDVKDGIIKKLDYFISKTGNSVLLKRLKNLGIDEYEKRKNILNIENEDILLVEDASIISDKVVKELQEKVRIIAYHKGKQIDGFIMLQRDSMKIFETKYFALAEKDTFEKELEKIKNTSKKDKEYLKNIIEDYKRERVSDNVE